MDETRVVDARLKELAKTAEELGTVYRCSGYQSGLPAGLALNSQGGTSSGHIGGSGENVSM